MTEAPRIGMLVGMRAPWVVGLLAMTACGRIAFDSRADSGGDGMTGDDSPPGETPRVLAFDRVAQIGPVGAVQATFDVPAEANFLLVSINVASNCLVDTSVTTIAGVTLASSVMSAVEQVVGTPCGTALTRSELWSIESPAAGPGSVNVALIGAQTPRSVHVGMFALAGVDLAQPIADTQVATGAGDANTTVSVATAPGELVLSFVGQGAQVGTSDAQILYVQNVDNNYTLNNSGAATASGASPSVGIRWDFPVPDEWQIITASVC
jgi:hypothetical protein